MVIDVNIFVYFLGISL